MFKNILFAVEFDHEEQIAALNIKKLVTFFAAKLSVIHVVELPSINIFSSDNTIEVQYLTYARDKLSVIGKSLDVSPDDQFVAIGNPKAVIPAFMKNQNFDLLIVGHHERQAVYHMLGSTAHALLAEAKCAVLVLHYPPSAIT